MTRWIVYTPEYGVVIPVLDDGTGPMEYGADVVAVEAENRRDAIACGVRLMLQKGYRWCRDRRVDGCSPYAGVKAELSILDPELDPKPFANYADGGC